MASGQYIRFDLEQYDYGNNYNPATGVYTVRYDGLYLIHARLFGVDNNARHYIEVDGTEVTYTSEYDNVHSEQSSSTSITLHLQTGQEVAIALNGGGIIHGGTSKMYSSFGATLLYSD